MSVLEDLRESLAPIITPALDEYLQAIAAMFEQVEDLTLDTVDLDGHDLPGWGKFFDVDQCPTGALPYLAQFVGETLPTTLTDTQAREQIRSQPNRRRGTPAGLTAAARATLTDPKQVIFRERDPAACPAEPAYGLTIVTYTSQTPDPAATEAAIRSVLPAGIVLNYETLDGWDITAMEAAGYTDLTALEDAFPTIDQFEVNLV
jgi:hypothetical protein